MITQAAATAVEGAAIMAASDRIERDSMGELRVPADALWGAQTQRAVQNFQISGHTVSREIIHALADVKAAAALSNASLGVLERRVADAIVEAAAQVASGHHDDQFPLSTYQSPIILFLLKKYIPFAFWKCISGITYTYSENVSLEL